MTTRRAASLRPSQFRHLILAEVLEQPARRDQAMTFERRVASAFQVVCSLILVTVAIYGLMADISLPFKLLLWAGIIYGIGFGVLGPLRRSKLGNKQNC